MDKQNFPRHIAIIPDGNRRWAAKNNLPSFEGHRKGFDTLVAISKKSRELGIKVLTVWGFSTENWKRSEKEISYLMNLFKIMIDKFLKDALKNKIRIVHLGRKDRLDKILIEKIKKAEKQTQTFDKYYLCIALDYGGRDEIVNAVSKIKNIKIKLSESEFGNLMNVNNLPYFDPDLIIRTGGEKRLSGFLLWQSQYAELMFVDKYLPDFSETDFENCIKEYLKRQRRFGK